MKRGSNMFWVKIMFVVLCFSQLLTGVLSVTQKPYHKLVKNRCIYKSCQVAICPHGTMTKKIKGMGERITNAIWPQNRAYEIPSDPKAVPHPDEVQMLKEWDMRTAYKGVKPRFGVCAILLEDAIDKVTTWCASYCKYKYNCDDQGTPEERIAKEEAAKVLKAERDAKAEEEAEWMFENNWLNPEVQARWRRRGIRQAPCPKDN